jgi:hypothetical protein
MTERTRGGFIIRTPTKKAYSARELEQLELEAQQALKDNAPASVFEDLRKRGWREPSALEGSGLDPCPPECGVCYPPERSRRTKRR